VRGAQVIGLGVLLGLLGCTGVSWVEVDGVVSDHRMAVEIEQYTFKGEPKDAGFAHPATLSAEGLATYLLYLRYEYPGVFKKSIEPAVLPEHLNTLAFGVTEGLKRSNQGQRVRFSVVNMHRQLKLLPVGKTTRGVAFIRPAGVLNLAFDLIDDDPDIDKSGELLSTKWEDPTRRTISTFKLVVPPGSRLYRDPEGNEHPLWLTIPFETISPAPAKPEGDLTHGESRVPPPLPPERAPPVPPPDLSTSPAQPPTSPAAPPAPAASTPPEAPDKKVITDQERIYRLRYLHELYEKKVITEEEYNREWNKIFRQY
jgi:hypothetical protein